MAKQKVERLIPVNITKLEVKNIALKFGSESFNYSAEISLVMDSGTHITSFYMQSDGWDEKTKLEVPIEMIELAGKIRELAEAQVIINMNRQQKTLDHKK